jgi:hypothetical protein
MIILTSNGKILSKKLKIKLKSLEEKKIDGELLRFHYIIGN